MTDLNITVSDAQDCFFLDFNKHLCFVFYLYQVFKRCSSERGASLKVELFQEKRVREDGPCPSSQMCPWDGHQVRVLTLHRN